MSPSRTRTAAGSPRRSNSPSRRRKWPSDTRWSDLEGAKVCGTDIEKRLVELCRVADLQNAKLQDQTAKLARTKEEITAQQALLEENRALVARLQQVEEDERQAYQQYQQQNLQSSQSQVLSPSSSTAWRGFQWVQEQGRCRQAQAGTVTAATPAAHGQEGDASWDRWHWDYDAQGWVMQYQVPAAPPDRASVELTAAVASFLAQAGMAASQSHPMAAERAAELLQV